MAAGTRPQDLRRPLHAMCPFLLLCGCRPTARAVAQLLLRASAAVWSTRGNQPSSAVWTEMYLSNPHSVLTFLSAVQTPTRISLVSRPPLTCVSLRTLPTSTRTR